mgnify:CR=1 FL=1
MEIRPFRSIRYNEKIVGDLASVICPPYDVITPELQKFCYQRSDHNIIRLECPMADGLETTEYSYKRAAATFRKWLDEGVLKFDDTPAFYLHDCYFSYLGVERRRRGLIARLRLVPWGSDICPHEETSPKDKSDRLQLMRACQASFSPLFCLYQDPKKEIASIFSEVTQDNPIISSPLMGEDKGEGDERHVVWAITDPELKQRLSTLSRQVAPVIMADGHHRYETALVYQQECSAGEVSLLGEAEVTSLREEASNYVMVALVEFSDPGLAIPPIHRLVRGIKAMSRLEDFFTLEFVPLSNDTLQSLFSSSGKYQMLIRGYLLGVLGLKRGYLVLLRERQDASLKDMMPVNRSQAYRDFDISILNQVVLGKVLGLDMEEGNIAHTVDAVEAYEQVERGEYQLAFLVNPPQPETIKAVVDAGDRLPRKSTYFYPKMPAGLIINSLD